MSDSLPSVTLIVPFKPGPGEIQSVAAASRLDYPKDRVEILVARGRQPAIQRNRALEQAKGDLIYFLDDDSIPDPGNLRRAAEHFREPAVKMVGGPNVCPPDAPPLEHAFALAMGSWLAFGPSRARYVKTGRTRATSEKELILCNLMSRRDTLVELGGFNESLYPNEENALMDELLKRGGRMIYDPDFLVYRRPRRTVSAFARMLWNYGRGRAEQFRLHPTPGSVLNFAPPLFCVYLPMAAAWRGWLLWPLAAYALAVLAQTLALRGPKGWPMARVAAAIAMTHLWYGAGFWRGLFTRLGSPASEKTADITIEHVASA